MVPQAFALGRQESKGGHDLVDFGSHSAVSLKVRSEYSNAGLLSRFCTRTHSRDHPISNFQLFPKTPMVTTFQ